MERTPALGAEACYIVCSICCHQCLQLPLEYIIGRKASTATTCLRRTNRNIYPPAKSRVATDTCSASARPRARNREGTSSVSDRTDGTAIAAAIPMTHRISPRVRCMLHGVLQCARCMLHDRWLGQSAGGKAAGAENTCHKRAFGSQRTARGSVCLSCHMQQSISTF